MQEIYLLYRQPKSKPAQQVPNVLSQRCEVITLCTSAELKKEWRPTSTPHACLHGVPKDNIALFLHIQYRTAHDVNFAWDSQHSWCAHFMTLLQNSCNFEPRHCPSSWRNEHKGRKKLHPRQCCPTKTSGYADTAKTKKCFAQEGALPLVTGCDRQRPVLQG